MTKYPTISRTLSLIREMGLNANYRPEYQEFQVTIPGNRESTYFTDSRHDALFTARRMKENN